VGHTRGHIKGGGLTILLVTWGEERFRNSVLEGGSGTERGIGLSCRTGTNLKCHNRAGEESQLYILERGGG